MCRFFRGLLPYYISRHRQSMANSTWSMRAATLCDRRVAYLVLGHAWARQREYFSSRALFLESHLRFLCHDQWSTHLLKLSKNYSGAWGSREKPRHSLTSPVAVSLPAIKAKLPTRSKTPLRRCPLVGPGREFCSPLLFETSEVLTSLSAYETYKIAQGYSLGITF